MNIVRINQAIFDKMNEDQSCGFCWSYTYARKDYANLKSNHDRCCIHVYMEDFTTDRIRNSDGLLIGNRHTFTLKILLDSLLDIQIFNELEPEDAKSKFSEYVEPLLDCVPDAYSKLICMLGIEIERERIQAKYNLKDKNQDGIIYSVTINDNCNAITIDDLNQTFGLNYDLNFDL